jgi:hypothetical protein
MRFCASVLLVCVLTLSTFGWHNGPKSSPAREGFGMHEWIAFEALQMAKKDGVRGVIERALGGVLEEFCLTPLCLVISMPSL